MYIYFIEIVEGIYRPQYLEEKAYNNFGGKTTGFLMRIMKIIFGIGIVIVLGSKFCVFKGISFPIQSWLLVAEVIKKIYYSQTYVTGNTINNHMKDNSLLEVEVLNSILDRKEFEMFSTK